jgi:hypothetical protein
MANKPKLATLTLDENKAWELAFAFHKNTGKCTVAADRLAWRDVCREFPRLKKFDGAK